MKSPGFLLFVTGALAVAMLAQDTFPMKSNPSFLPLPLYGSFGQAFHRCDFSEREAAEKLQVNDLGNQQ